MEKEEKVEGRRRRRNQGSRKRRVKERQVGNTDRQADIDSYLGRERRQTGPNAKELVPPLARVIYAGIHKYVCTYACMYICMYVWICVCIYVFVFPACARRRWIRLISVVWRAGEPHGAAPRPRCFPRAKNARFLHPCFICPFEAGFGDLHSFAHCLPLLGFLLLSVIWSSFLPSRSLFLFVSISFFSRFLLLLVAEFFLFILLAFDLPPRKAYALEVWMFIFVCLFVCYSAGKSACL